MFTFIKIIKNVIRVIKSVTIYIQIFPILYGLSSPSEVISSTNHTMEKPLGEPVSNEISPRLAHFPCHSLKALFSEKDGLIFLVNEMQQLGMNTNDRILF